MISENDLKAAIAECEGQRSPNASTCIKLAAFYIIKNELYGEKEAPEPPPSFKAVEKSRSYDAMPVLYDSGTEFSRLVNGANPNDIIPLVDELLTALTVMSPRLYDSFMSKLSSIL